MVGASSSHEHNRRIRRELVQAGATAYGLFKSESRFLPLIIHEDEHIQAIVYGQHHNSSVMLVATDHRIIYLDKKPMAVFMDEITYDVVSGIEFEIHTLFAGVILHTAVGNYDIHNANIHCAEKFATYIEEQRVKREKLKEETKQSEIPVETKRNLVKEQIADTLHKNLAGYYLLPLGNVEEPEEAKV